MTRGTFILIEGLDRAGKSTQCEKLVEWLNEQGKETVLMRFPNRETVIGQMINSYLKNASKLSDQAIHLLFSANRWEALDEMKAKLEAGINIVVDRYVYSGIAFSAAKNIDGMDVNWCKQCDIGLPAPDVTVFLDVSEEVAKARGGYGDERYEKEQFQRQVRDYFRRIRESEEPINGEWTVISADNSSDQVNDDIKKAVSPHLSISAPLAYIK
ncbi:thymidylate kinase [Trichomonascus vanleenenianus]|uniref:bifunctional thymidylate/uridylate kinase n=1 Tax=Trichomonascus vanleenenianus TaxID=2268995 RepID=UPI003ECB2E2D